MFYQSREQYPMRVKKGRPKFLLENKEQARRGPHRLSRVPDAPEIPAPINKFLREYQRQGVEFLYRQYSENIGGSKHMHVKIRERR